MRMLIVIMGLIYCASLWCCVNVPFSAPSSWGLDGFLRGMVPAGSSSKNLVAKLSRVYILTCKAWPPVLLHLCFESVRFCFEGSNKMCIGVTQGYGIIPKLL